VEGFNIEMNCGKDVGQPVFHWHIHLIPGRKGDVEKPARGRAGRAIGNLYKPPAYAMGRLPLLW